MADVALGGAGRPAALPDRGLWARLKTNREWLGAWFMMPTAILLLLFLAYPLVKGIWMSFTDARIGRGGAFVGLENYEWLWDDDVFWLSVFNTLLYTFVASVIKFGIGLYLALLLNRHIPFKAIIRSIILIPFVVPTVLSAIAFWWIFDSQFSIISWSLRHMGLIDTNINFLGDQSWARTCVIFVNIWRGVPFIAITLLAGLQTVSPSLYEAATIDGATRWQILTRIMLPLAVPGLISAGIFAFTLSWNEFIYALTFIQSSENKTVPVGVLTELVRGDVYEWGALMAGALLGSLPVVLLYSFFVDYYVSSMTGAVKE